MIVILNQDQIIIDNILLIEKKPNIIFEGFFTKILYSDKLFTMNGIFLHFNIQNYKFNENKTAITYAPHSLFGGAGNGAKPSLDVIYKSIYELENRILEFYNKMTNSNKTINHILSKSLQSGYIKIFNNNTHYKETSHDFHTITGAPVFYVKISGIWETNSEVGITYKIYKSSFH